MPKFGGLFRTSRRQKSGEIPPAVTGDFTSLLFESLQIDREIKRQNQLAIQDYSQLCSEADMLLTISPPGGEPIGKQETAGVKG